MARYSFLFWATLLIMKRRELDDQVDPFDCQIFKAHRILQNELFELSVLMDSTLDVSEALTVSLEFRFVRIVWETFSRGGLLNVGRLKS